MHVIWEPIHSPTGSVVGKRQTGARAEILGDPQRRIWEQRGESLEAFEKRVKAAAADVARTQDFPPSER
jgi:broad specificity phosphatase PhoE